MDAESTSGASAGAKPKFKKRSEMSQQEKKEDNQRKRAREKANKEKAKERPDYAPKPKKAKTKSHRYEFEFRFPERWGDKITLSDYHMLMGEFGARSVRDAMSIIEGGGTLAEEETSLGSGMWVEYGDRSKDYSQLDPGSRFGHGKPETGPY